MEDWAQRVKALKAAQHRQVMQVELHLETTPRDSRFSAALLDLMKKHDATPKDAANAAAIGQRCDEMLKQETRAFFAKVVAANTRKWQTLRGKLEEERKTIRYPVGASLQSASAHSKPGGVTAADLDREAERLEIDYHQNWFKYESLHLQVSPAHSCILPSFVFGSFRAFPGLGQGVILIECLLGRTVATCGRKRSNRKP